MGERSTLHSSLGIMPQTCWSTCLHSLLGTVFTLGQVLCMAIPPFISAPCPPACTAYRRQFHRRFHPRQCTAYLSSDLGSSTSLQSMEGNDEQVWPGLTFDIKLTRHNRVTRDPSFSGGGFLKHEEMTNTRFKILTTYCSDQQSF